MKKNQLGKKNQVVIILKQLIIIFCLAMPSTIVFSKDVVLASPSSLATDYFRSKTTGNWNAISSWESSPDNITWANATLIPTSASSGINILATHSITIGATVVASVDQTTISGSLEVNGGSISIANGTGDDITIINAGVLKTFAVQNYSTEFIYAASANIHILTGGKITVGNGGANAGNFEGFATSLTNIWDDAAINEWNSTGTFAGSNINWFPAAAVTKPILRVSATMLGAPGGSAPTTINGILEVNAPMAFASLGAKTFRDGIIGTSILTLPATIGTPSIANVGAILGGNLTLIIDKTLVIANGVTVPLGANVLLSNTSTANISKTGGSFLVNGTIDITDRTITNTSGDVTINGTLKTSKTNGLYSPGNIASGTINLNTGSTIEYNALVNQSITGTLNYYNITFSGAGIKTPLSAVGVDVNGTVKITGAASVDASNNNIGTSSANNTSLIMDGTGAFIVGTGGTMPLMAGPYNLTAGIVRYAGTTPKTIRSKAYQNIEVTGTTVGNSSGNITLNANGTFIVKTGAVFSINDNSITCPAGGGSVTVENAATFKTGNSKGFSGFAATFTDNSSIHANILPANINLGVGSTVDYAGSAAQLISNQIPYQNFAISSTAAVNKTAPGNAAGDLIILGNITKGTGATFLNNAGTVSLEGTAAQTYNASDAGMEFYTLVNKNNVGFTVANNLGIVNKLQLNPSSKLTLVGGDINLRSTIIQTAIVPDLGTINIPIINYTGLGRFNVERFLPLKTSWRLLSTPVDIATSASIRDSWQESGAAIVGYGTQISGPVGGTGIDYTTQRGSLKYFDAATQNYIEITNTTTAKARTEGYYVFVRGDRTAGIAGGTVATTMRTKGRIVTGTQPAVAVPANSFITWGNPYASAIDFRNVARTNTADAFIVWNPQSAGSYNVGAFETYNRDIVDGHYKRVPFGIYGNIRDTIMSGEAIFLQNNIGIAGTVVAKENDKVQGPGRNVSRVGTASRTGVISPALEINLYTNNTGGSNFLADGAMLHFDNSFSNAVDNDDVKKISNAADNISIQKDNTKLVVEKRTVLHALDTIFLSLTSTRIAGYRLEITPSILHNLPLEAFLKDNFLQTETLISLTALTNINFNITSDAASKVANRFMILFKAAPAALPLSFTNITATKNTDKTNTVKFTVDNEINNTLFTVERSATNTGFSGIGNNIIGNGSGSYWAVDAAPIAGTNYYRVKATIANGQVLYSDVVKLTDDAFIKPSFTIEPNPVLNKTLHVHFKNMSGKYNIKLVTKHGATLFETALMVTTSNEIQNIILTNAISTGIYSCIIKSNDQSFVESVFIN